MNAFRPNWELINKARVRTGLYMSENSDGFNGAFGMMLCHELLRIIASDGEGWRHVSVSRMNSHKCPTWEMMCAVKDIFYGPSVWVVQYHPAETEYVNNHPGCLHLWECTEGKFPTPPAILVGIKGNLLTASR